MFASDKFWGFRRSYCKRLPDTRFVPVSKYHLRLFPPYEGFFLFSANGLIYIPLAPYTPPQQAPQPVHG